MHNRRRDPTADDGGAPIDTLICVAFAFMMQHVLVLTSPSLVDQLLYIVVALCTLLLVDLWPTIDHRVAASGAFGGALMILLAAVGALMNKNELVHDWLLTVAVAALGM